MKLNRSIRILSLAAGALVLAVLYRRYVLYANYENPPSVFTYSLLVEYFSFAAIGFLFPWSFRFSARKMVRIFTVATVAIAFAVGYLVLLSLVEWLESGQTYRWMNGLKFNLSSVPVVLVIYGAVSIFLYYINDKFVAAPKSYLTKIEARLKNQVQFVLLNNVELIGSEGNYISLIDKEGKSFLSRKTLKEIEREIDPAEFVRIHRQHIVRADSVAGYQADQGGGYILTLMNSKQVKLSRGYSHQMARFRLH